MEKENQAITPQLIFVGVLIVIVSIFVVIVGRSITPQSRRIVKKTQAQKVITITQNLVSPLSSVEGGVVVEADIISKRNTALITSTMQQGAAALDFLHKLEKVPVVLPEEKGANVLGATTDENVLLPSSFTENAALSRVLDEQDAYAFSSRIEPVHYYYTQQLPHLGKKIPVYGSQVRLDIDGDNKLIGVSVSVVKDTRIHYGVVSYKEAQEKALIQGEREYGGAVVLCSNDALEYVINRNLLTNDTDVKNYHTFMISVCDGGGGFDFNTRYFVASENREIVFQESRYYGALSRTIKNCKTGSCKTARTEGSQASGDSEVDKSYTIFGNVYNFYKNSFGRDSFDNRGASLNAYVNYPSSSSFKCPNAAYSPDANVVVACTGLVAQDVWAHELTHAVTNYTASLIYQNQQGALNESFSDIFGWGNDQDDWTMGEDTTLGILRRLDDPTRSKRAQPDKVFSSNYYCGTSDKGGVHINNGVLNKGFYLMVEGGTFNKCTISGIGAEKSLQIMYKALTAYLKPTSNFKDAYTAIVRSCTELYGESSGECQTTKAALQAVEMDQQTAASTSPVCTSKKAQTATCAGSSLTPLPTSPVSPNPTLPGATPTPLPPENTPTLGPTLSPDRIKGMNYESGCLSNSPITAIQTFRKASYECANGTTGSVGDGTTCYTQAQLNELALAACSQGQDTTPTPTPKPTVGPTVPYPTDEPTGIPYPTDPDSEPSVSPYPTDDIYPSDTPYPTDEPYPDEGSISLTLTLRFQGITKQPASGYDAMMVRVGLVGEGYVEPDFSDVQFVAGSDGLWRGSVTFSGKSGEYYILVKGPMHIQQKFCTEDPIEDEEGSYSCNYSHIVLYEGYNELDFSNVVLIAGDLPQQDGVVNAADLYAIRANIGLSTQSALWQCDVNKDQKCNTQDYALILAGLSVKTDAQ